MTRAFNTREEWTVKLILKLCDKSKSLFNLSLDESGPPKSPWGINIMKKTKKAGPKAFGVRLEDCQPGVNNKVSLDILCLTQIQWNQIFYWWCNSVCVLLSSSRWSWRSAAAWWRTWVWSTPGSTESPGTTPWCRCFRISSTRASTSTLQRRWEDTNTPVHGIYPDWWGINHWTDRCLSALLNKITHHSMRKVK